MEKVTVSFPGLGIGETTLNPVAFTLFGKIEVRWYGIFITLGMMLALVYVLWRAKKSEGVKPDDVIDVGLVAIILSIIGARLYYVLTTLGEYRYDSFLDVIALWNGGLGVYGGVLGGALGIFIVCRVKKIKSLRLYDAAVPAVMFAQMLGRWGNFFNGEAYGYQIVNGGSRYFFFLKEFSIPVPSWLRMGLSPNEFTGNTLAYVHPTFLYESLWNLIGFLLLNLFYRKKKFNGQILLSYLAWYGFGRMFIEGLRTDSLYICKGIFGTDGIRISQLVGLLCFLIGAALLIFIPVYRKKHPCFAAYEKPVLETGAPAETVEEPAETTAQPEEAHPAATETTPEVETIPETALSVEAAPEPEKTEQAPEVAPEEAPAAETPTPAEPEPLKPPRKPAAKKTTAGTTTKKTTTGTTTKKTATGTTTKQTTTAKKATGTTRSKGDVFPVTPKKKRTTTIKIQPKAATKSEKNEEPEEHANH